MRERGEWRAALAMLASTSGLGMTSGLALTLFFGQFRAAWPTGMLVSSTLYGLLVAGVAGQAAGQDRGREGAAWVCRALMCLLAGLAAAFMLYRLGRLGELTLPMSHSYELGALLGFGAALLLGAASLKWHERLGASIALFAAAFFAANALDPRPVRVAATGTVEFALAGSYGGAVCFGALFAALNGCAAYWQIHRLAPGSARPAAVGARAALMQAVLLTLGVAALERGGDVVMAQPMPFVVLSARWGLAGFWLCALLQALGAVATLSAALGLLLGRSQGDRISRRLAAATIMTGALVFVIMSCSRLD